MFPVGYYLVATQTWLERKALLASVITLVLPIHVLSSTEHVPLFGYNSNWVLMYLQHDDAVLNNKRASIILLDTQGMD